MRFSLIDRIIELAPGQRIEAVKNLSLGEEYLADHFPGFPVLPGVLMLETLVQAGAWLVRTREDFAHSVVVLREAKGVKYGHFMTPGKQLRVRVEAADKGPPTGPELAFKGSGEVDGVATVSARFTLGRYNLRERHADLAQVDEALRSHYRNLFALLQIGLGSRTAPAG
jgi:3-hydroxyacyl-[acyl-carrier-protein] dehydratase